MPLTKVTYSMIEGTLVNVSDYGAVGNGTTDDTAAIKAAIAASEGKTLVFDSTKSYKVAEYLTIPSNVTIDFCGATIVDNVQGNWKFRSAPLFTINNVSNVTIRNLVYTCAVTRDDATGYGAIFYLGDPNDAADNTYNITLENVTVLNAPQNNFFVVAISAETYNVNVSNFNVYGDITWGINSEYGDYASLGEGTAAVTAGALTGVTITNGSKLFVTGDTVEIAGKDGSGTGAFGTVTAVNGVATNIAITSGGSGFTNGEDVLFSSVGNVASNYGKYPHNITVTNFNGYDNSICQGFLRVAACYDVKFVNCYGKNVKNFIFAWTGDKGIQRLSENVVFENCSHYASNDFLAGTPNATVQVLATSIEGSLGYPNPPWTNWSPVISFNNCQFETNKETGSSAVRYYGTKGSVVFNACIMTNSYYGVSAGPSVAVTYKAERALTFNDCLFINNSRDVYISGMNGVEFNCCKFKNTDGTLIPVKIDSNSYINNFYNCSFTGLQAAIPYVVIDANCGRNKFESCYFDNTGSTHSIDTSSVTLGRDNVSDATYLTRPGYSYFGIQGEPSTLIEDLANVSGSDLDVFRRTQYVATTNITKTLNRIVNGMLGDVVIVQATDSAASITFTNAAAGVPTLERIITSTGSDVTKTGSKWTARLQLTSAGWLLS